MRAEVLKGHLDTLLLATLTDGPRHGSWSTVNGRRRRSHDLTAAGRRTHRHERSSWQEFSTAVTALLRDRPWPAAT
jgi:PadR family transcriptional regulator PadR